LTTTLRHTRSPRLRALARGTEVPSLPSSTVDDHHQPPV